MLAGTASGCDVDIRQSGFTLIELMMVLAIVGVLATTVVIGFTGADYRRHLQTEAERLALAIELARSEALRSNEIWGLAVAERAYSFKRYEAAAAQWVDVARRPFTTWTAEAGIAFQIDTALDRRDFAVDDETADWESPAEDEPEWPDVAIHPGGEMTPFDVTVALDVELPADGAPFWVVRSDGIQRARALDAGSLEDADREYGRRPTLSR